jgi:hypothetical protein
MQRRRGRGDFWTVLVDLLVGLLVAFPTAARVFWCSLHGFFTTDREAHGSFGAAVMAVCARHAPERQEPRTASKRPVPVERATVLPCSLALHNPPIADTACFLNPCAGLEQQHSPEAVARMSRAVVKRQQAQDSRGRAEAASMAAGEPPAQWRSSVEDRPHAHAALRRHGIPEVRSSARRRVHSLNPYACPIGRSHAPRP